MKQLRFFLLTILASIAVSANAVIQSGSCGENVTYVLNDDGTLVISGTGEMKEYYNTAPWYNNRSKILRAEIEYGVTSIGDHAFYECSSLASVTIPNSVTSIGYYAFHYCSSLTSIIIPSSVTNIRNNAFEQCVSLTSLVVNNYNRNYSSVDNVLFNKDKTVLIRCAGGKKGEYIIPASVTSIGGFAFEGCSSLTSVTIPNSVVRIGYKAFSVCSGLTSVTIPNSVTSIGGSAFSDCSSLTSVTIPNSVTSIGMEAFYNCM